MKHLIASTKNDPSFSSENPGSDGSVHWGHSSLSPTNTLRSSTGDGIALHATIKGRFLTNYNACSGVVALVKVFFEYCLLEIIKE